MASVRRACARASAHFGSASMSGTGSFCSRWYSFCSRIRHAFEAILTLSGAVWRRARNELQPDPASEVSGGSDGRESSRRRCHNAGWSPARPEHAAQRRQRCCIAAISRPEHPSPMWAPCRKKMLKDVRVACHAHNPTAPPHPHRPCSHRRRFACVRRCVKQLGS